MPDLHHLRKLHASSGIAVLKQDGLLTVVSRAPIEGLLQREIGLRGRRQVAVVVFVLWLAACLGLGFARAGLQGMISSGGWFLFFLVAGIGYVLVARLANRTVVTLSETSLRWNDDAIPWPGLEIPIDHVQEFYTKLRTRAGNYPNIDLIIALTRRGRTECVGMGTRKQAGEVAAQLNLFLAQHEARRSPEEAGPGMAGKRRRLNLRDVLIAAYFFLLPALTIAVLAPWKFAPMMRGGQWSILIPGSWFLIGCGFSTIGYGGVSMFRCMLHSRGYQGRMILGQSGLFPLRFVWRNWDEAKRPFLIQVAGLAMLILACVVMWLR